MSSHQLAIAKASFSACLLRPDPISISRDEIAHFHSLVNAVVTKCSRTNIQECKRWILRNVTQSAARIVGLGKYLSALVDSFTGSTNAPASSMVGREPSVKRKRLYLLYLINDLLNHEKLHACENLLSSKLQPFLIGLTKSAASFKKSPKHQQKLLALLDIWEDREYYAAEYVEKLRDTVKIAPEIEDSKDTSEHVDRDSQYEGAKPSKITPFNMPALHGDQGTPWYDLPAGNLLPHIIPNSTRPINPSLIKPLQFVGGPADEVLANAVKDLLQDVHRIFGITQCPEQQEDNIWDIDELGQPIIRDVRTGEILSGEGYYGWSKAFCKKMKRRRKGLDYRGAGSSDENRRRDQSFSGSSSQSSRNFKRRRYSNSNRSQSQSRSRSRSRDRDRDMPMHGQRSHSSSRSSSENRGRTMKREKHPRTSSEGYPRSASREGSRRDSLEKSYSPQPHSRPYSPSGEPVGGTHGNTQGNDTHVSSIREQRYQVHPPPHDFIPPADYQYGHGLSPLPPPLPPQYQGQWPPPPPPPPMIPYSQQAQTMGSWPPPPPPPPPSQQWPSAPYGQPAPASTGWTMPPHQTGNGSRAYGGRGRGIHGATQHAYQGGASGYDGYGRKGDMRGRGRS